MRARAVALMRISLFIKRGKAAYEADGVYLEFANPAAVADVFEDCVIPHAAAAAFAHFCIHAVRDFLYTDWVRPKIYFSPRIKSTKNVATATRQLVSTLARNFVT